MSASTSKMRRAKQTRRGNFSIEGPWVILVHDRGRKFSQIKVKFSDDINT